MSSNQDRAFNSFKIGTEDDVEEEQPEMRAVAIGSAAPSLRMGGDLGGLKFGKAPPLGITRPAPVSRRRSTSIAVKQVWNEENWKIKDPLEQVPIDFPLERTHREIHDADASEVARRISNALRLLSVDAEYDCEKAKAKCTTSDSVSFRIRLFAAGEDGMPVVVEVQRRNGSTASFMRICRKILDGAEGVEIKPETEPSRKRMPPFMKGPVGSMKCLQGMPKPTTDSQVSAGIEKALQLIRAKEKDTNMLGVENLCFLTDPLKTRPDVALKACKAVMIEKQCSEIREEIAVMLQKDAFLPEEFEGDEDAMTMQDKARHLSLVLLSNTLGLTSKDGCLAKAIKGQKWFSEFLIPSLLDEVKSFESSGNNAYEAACSLTSMASCSEVARRIMTSHSAIEDLRAAFAFGSQFHELLANESERTLHALGESI